MLMSESVYKCKVVFLPPKTSVVLLYGFNFSMKWGNAVFWIQTLETLLQMLLFVCLLHCSLKKLPNSWKLPKNLRFVLSWKALKHISVSSISVNTLWRSSRNQMSSDSFSVYLPYQSETELVKTWSHKTLINCHEWRLFWSYLYTFIL